MGASRAGRPQDTRDAATGWTAREKGNKRGAAYAYNIKELRNREIDVARHAEHAYEQFVSRWQRRGPSKRRTGAANEERR